MEAAGKALHGPDSLCGIEGNAEGTRCANLPVKEHSRVFMRGSKSKLSKDGLNLTKKSLRIIVTILTGYCRVYILFPEEARAIHRHSLQILSGKC